MQIRLGRAHFLCDSRWIFLVPALMAICAGGCTTTQVVTKALGVQGPYVFYGFDSIGPPGEPAQIVVRLQKGPYLNDEEGVLIRFLHEGRFVALSRTDDEGYARATFTAEETGDYNLTAEVLPGQLTGQAPEPAPIFVCIREPSEKIIIVDIDKTLVASSFDEVLAGTAQPMPDSKEALHELAKDNTVLYLTLRLDYFGPKTKQWLDQQGYPPGPLWVARFHGLFQGNRDYRRSRIQQLRTTYARVHTGFGDKISDAVAYLANEMTAVLLIRPEKLDEPDDLRELADAVAALPQRVIVVSGWRQARDGLNGSEKFTPHRMSGRLRSRAEQLERK